MMSPGAPPQRLRNAKLNLKQVLLPLKSLRWLPRTLVERRQMEAIGGAAVE